MSFTLSTHRRRKDPLMARLDYGIAYCLHTCFFLSGTLHLLLYTFFKYLLTWNVTLRLDYYLPLWTFWIIIRQLHLNFGTWLTGYIHVLNKNDVHTSLRLRFFKFSIIIKCKKDTFTPFFWFLRQLMASFYSFQCLLKHLLKLGFCIQR